jgi:hypothetical protein
MPKTPYVFEGLKHFYNLYITQSDLSKQIQMEFELTQACFLIKLSE